MAEPSTGVALVVHPSAGDRRSDRVLVQTVRALRERGWRVAAALPSSGALAALLAAEGVAVETVDAPVLRKRDLGVLGVARFGHRSVSAARRMRRALRRVSPDVVIVSTMTQPGWILAAHLRRIPVLVHVQEHDTTAPHLVREAIASPLRVADRILVDSPVTAEALLDVVPSLAAKVVVVPTGIIGPDAVIPPRERLTDGLRICCIARIEPGTGIRTVIDALALLVGDGVRAQLDVVAPSTDPDTLARLLTHAGERGVDDLVTIVHAGDDLWPALTAADVAVVPSRTETSFGGTAVEALLAGRPVVVTTSKGMAESTDGFASAIPVDDGDPHALAGALHRIATTWSAFRTSAVALAPVAAQRFSPDAYRSAFAAEVRSLVEPRSRSLAA